MSVCVCVHACVVYRCVPVRLYECVWGGGGGRKVVVIIISWKTLRGGEPGAGRRGGWMDEWIGGLTGVWIYGWMDGWMGKPSAVFLFLLTFRDISGEALRKGKVYRT